MGTSSNRRVRYAVVGLGNIAQVAVLPAFAHAKENSELVALLSSDEKKLRALGEKYDVATRAPYDALEEVIQKTGVDAVYVATPNTHHRDLTERAARAGAHVLCEKPMAPTEADCRAMIAATEAAGVKLMIAYRLHFDRANLDAVERIRAGQIGEPRFFSSIFSQQVREGDIRTRGQLGGGAIFDMGIYCINAARYLFQDEPTEVCAQRVTGTDERFRDVDEMTTAVLRFPGDRLAQLTASQGAGDVSELRVVGTKGDIRLDPAYGYEGKLRMFVTIDGKTEEKTFAKSDQFAPELVHFSQCILDGKDPEPSGAQGLADVRIIQAILLSARTQASVSIAPVEQPARPAGDLAMKKPAVGKVEPVNAPSPSR
jgi:predicted dehydrogenase